MFRLTDESHIVLSLKCFSCREQGDKKHERVLRHNDFRPQRNQTVYYLSNDEFMKLQEMKPVVSAQWSKGCTLVLACSMEYVPSSKADIGLFSSSIPPASSGWGLEDVCAHVYSKTGTNNTHIPKKCNAGCRTNGKCFSNIFNRRIILPSQVCASFTTSSF